MPRTCVGADLSTQDPQSRVQPPALPSQLGGLGETALPKLSTLKPPSSLRALSGSTPTRVGAASVGNPRDPLLYPDRRDLPHDRRPKATS